MRTYPISLILFSLLLAVSAMGSTMFNHQGRLLDITLPPTGAYDFEFKLSNAADGGTELGSVARPETPVNAGVSSVPLDFGDQF